MKIKPTPPETLRPATYRQRLPRTRARSENFVTKPCGLARTDATCHCHKQLPALTHQATIARAAIRAVLQADGFRGNERASH